MFPVLPRHARYQPSGRTSLGIFVLLLIPLLGLTLGLGFLLDVLFVSGFYYMFIVPVVLGVPLIAAVAGVVHCAKCRSPKLATLLAVLIGASYFLGNLYCGFVREGGAYTDLSNLPAYIAHRLQTDTDRDAPPDTEPSGADLFWNVFRVSLEFGAVLCLAVVAARAFAARPFCESCRRWGKQQRAALSLADADLVVAALEGSDFEALAQLRTIPMRTTQCRTQLTLFECAGRCGAQTFLSIEEVVPGANMSSNLQVIGRNQQRQGIALGADEVAAIRHFFDGSPAAKPSLTEPYAQIVPIRARDANQMLNTRAALISLSWNIGLPIGLMLLALGLMALLGEAEAISVCISAGIMSTSMILVLTTARRSRRRARRRMEEIFLRHRDPVVQWNDPETWVVEIVPRENWRLMLDTAEDIGLLRFDPAAGEIRFEGDRERMCIPRTSLLACEPLDAEVGNIAFPLAAIRIRTADGDRELPFYPDAVTHLSNKARRKRRDELIAALEEMLAENAQDAPPET